MVPVSDGHAGSESARLHDLARELSAFRSRLYGCFGRLVDALFELTDAILYAGMVPSPVHLSLAAVHRRGWGSIYAALAKGGIDEEALHGLLQAIGLRQRAGKTTRWT